MRIALVQPSDSPCDVTRNLAFGLTSLQTAADEGTDLVLFPELFLSGYYLTPGMQGCAAAASRALSRLQAAVDQSGVAAVVGLPVLDGDLLFNAVAVLRPDLPEEVYAKTHLFRGEKKWFTPGARFWTGEIAGWPCGIVVCYELGFPEISRCLALAGARLLLALAAFGRSRGDVWRASTEARALENSCYLAACGQAGSNGSIEFLGESRVLDPFGAVLATAGAGEALLVVDLDGAVVDDARAGARGGHTYFIDRRPELYGPLADGTLTLRGDPTGEQSGPDA